MASSVDAGLHGSFGNGQRDGDVAVGLSLDVVEHHRDPQIRGQLEQGLLDDPRRPRDVSLTGDWEPGRELDDALAES